MANADPAVVESLLQLLQQGDGRPQPRQHIDQRGRDGFIRTSESYGDFVKSQ